MSILPPPPHPRSWPPPSPPPVTDSPELAELTERSGLTERSELIRRAALLERSAVTEPWAAAERSGVEERVELSDADLVPYESAASSHLEDFSEEDLATTPYQSDYPPPDLQDHKRSWPEIRPAFNYSSWPPTVLDPRARGADSGDDLLVTAREFFDQARVWSSRAALQLRGLFQRGTGALTERFGQVVDDRQRGWLRTRAPYAFGLLVVAMSMFSIGRTVESASDDPAAGTSAQRPGAEGDASAAARARSQAAMSSLPQQSLSQADGAVAPTSPEISLPSVPGVSPSPDREALILVALAENLIAARRDAEAVPVLERALARNQKLTDDPVFLRVVKRAALSEDRMAAAQSYALLVGPMGERGAEILYEISVSPDSRRGIRERAAYYVYTKDFEKKAPLPLYAAFKLVSAPTCDAKKSLLPFAAEAGGRHALAYLRELNDRKVCTLDDLDNCYSCMNVDEELPRTITEIETRLGN